MNELKNAFFLKLARAARGPQYNHSTNPWETADLNAFNTILQLRYKMCAAKKYFSLLKIFFSLL